MCSTESVEAKLHTCHGRQLDGGTWRSRYHPARDLASSNDRYHNETHQHQRFKLTSSYMITWSRNDQSNGTYDRTHPSVWTKCSLTLQGNNRSLAIRRRFPAGFESFDTALTPASGPRWKWRTRRDAAAWFSWHHRSSRAELAVDILLVPRQLFQPRWPSAPNNRQIIVKITKWLKKSSKIIETACSNWRVALAEVANAPSNESTAKQAYQATLEFQMQKL